MLTQALPRVKADASDLDARMDCQIGTWLSMGRWRRGVPMGASHGIGYVLGAEFDVPHGYTSCVMLPSVMRWNKSVNAERQALVAAAMGHPGEDAGDVLDHFIRGLGMPRSLHEVNVGPEHFDRIAQAGDGNALGAAQPAQDRRPGAGARNSRFRRIREILETMYTGKHVHLRPLQPAFIMASTGEAVTYRELDARSNRLAHLFRNRGLKRLDHYSIFMENNSRYLEACGAGERVRAVFHLRQFVSDGERTRLHPHQQPVAHPDHLEGEARYRARGAEGMPEGRALHRRRRRRRKRPHRRPAARPPRVCRTRRSRTNASAPRCSIRRAPPAGPKGILRPLPEQPPSQQSAAVRFPAEALAVPRRHDLPVAGAALSFGAAGRGQSDDPHAAAPRSSWRASIPSVISSWSRNGASPTPSWCRRCSRGC